MQKQLRIGLLLVVLLLVVETARLFIAGMDLVDIQIAVVKQPTVIEALDDALGVTPTGQSFSMSGKTNPSPAPASFSTVNIPEISARPARPASTLNPRPSPDPTASPTPTLQPYRTVIPENKPERQATAGPTQAVSGTPAEISPEQPTSPPPEATSPAPTNPPATPTGAPDALPTPAPDEPPTPTSAP